MLDKETWYHRKITFDDGWELSIICKDHISYGHKEHLFECALISPTDGIDDNSVTGYLDFDDVAKYIRKAARKHNDKTNTTQD